MPSFVHTCGGLWQWERAWGRMVRLHSRLLWVWELVFSKRFCSYGYVRMYIEKNVYHVCLLVYFFLLYAVWDNNYTVSICIGFIIPNVGSPVWFSLLSTCMDVYEIQYTLINEHVYLRVYRASCLLISPSMKGRFTLPLAPAYAHMVFGLRQCLNGVINSLKGVWSARYPPSTPPILRKWKLWVMAWGLGRGIIWERKKMGVEWK